MLAEAVYNTQSQRVGATQPVPIRDAHRTEAAIGSERPRLRMRGICQAKKQYGTLRDARLRGADAMATDMRASVGLVLAGLAARWRDVVHRIYHLDRGYETLDRIQSGVDIRRVAQ